LLSAGGFAERFFSGARQRKLCREPNKKHSAKPLHSGASDKRLSAKKFLCRVPKKTLGKDFFAECQSKTLGKAIFQTMFWCPKRIQIKKFSTTKSHNFS
jgi:hypothetical protein